MNEEPKDRMNSQRENHRYKGPGGKAFGVIENRTVTKSCSLGSGWDKFIVLSIISFYLQAKVCEIQQR